MWMASRKSDDTTRDCKPAIRLANPYISAKTLGKPNWLGAID